MAVQQAPASTVNDHLQVSSRTTIVFTGRRTSEKLDVACPSKVWQKQGVGEDDGETHRHIAIALKVRTTKCVLCCRLCFDPDGLVYIREECHIAKRNSKVQVADKKDLGRRGHSATHKCLVCAVHLCHVKGRFPGCSLTCFELWHTVQHFSNDERTKTLCHVKCPAECRMDVVA